MPLNPLGIEELVAWCAASDELGEERVQARNCFFGYDEPKDVKYLPGADEVNNRERRFLGWFSFSHRLSDGHHPAELAATTFLNGEELKSAMTSIAGTRFVMAVTVMANPGKRFYLELEDEEFEVDHRQLSQTLEKGDALCAHLLPVSRGRWLVCPGWLVWPTRIGPNMRAHLKQFQLDPIQLERFLQQRSGEEDKSKVDYPRDNTLIKAVARMTAAAKAEGKSNLIKPKKEWIALVVYAMQANDINGFTQKVIDKVGNVQSVDEINKWLGLAMNIWNNTPQPDRGGKSPNQIAAEYKGEIKPF